MTDYEPELAYQQANHIPYRPGQQAGHYESFFKRANHPGRPLAFWIRYTLLSPDRRPEDALGELWAVYFDGETGQHVAVKREAPSPNAPSVPRSSGGRWPMLAWNQAG